MATKRCAARDAAVDNAQKVFQCLRMTERLVHVCQTFFYPIQVELNQDTEPIISLETRTGPREWKFSDGWSAVGALQEAAHCAISGLSLADLAAALDAVHQRAQREGFAPPGGQQ